MKITFRGAAGTVTGSMHQLDVGGERYLLDCGLYQGRRAEARRRNRECPVAASSIRAVVLSHAHIDHSGNLPSLARQGFQGSIHATPATADLCSHMLRDSAFIQEKDAQFLNKRRARKRLIDPAADGEPAEPLYTAEDVERTLPLFRPVGYEEPTALSERLSFEFRDAGHMLGSSSVLLHCRGEAGPVRLAFSGDVGRPGLPILRDPQPIRAADYLIIESTYGGRRHDVEKDVREKLAAVVRRTCERGGKLIVPAFAVGRTQQLVLLLNELTHEGRIPELPIFVDSPLAVNATEVFRDHPECYDSETRALLLDQRDPFAFGRLRYVRDVEESKALNYLTYPFIVLTASGMCEAGRVLHHLRNHIPDARNTVLITGFQAEHTLGRKLLEGRSEVPIFGEPVARRAEVVELSELSAHADQAELLAWMEPSAADLKKVFLVHGEPEQSEALAEAIRRRWNLDAVVPREGDSFDLS